MRTLVRYALLSALILPAIACKGPTGVSGNKQLNELDADDQKTACENLDTYYEEEIGEDRLLHFGCIFTTLFTATNEAECDLQLDRCKQEGLTESEEEDQCAVADDVTCTATVAEYEECVEEQVEATKALIDGLTCAAIHSGQEPSLTPEVGPACEAIAKKCPGFIDAPVEGE